jgi:DNA-binding SARP family transcriptional activator
VRAEVAQSIGHISARSTKSAEVGGVRDVSARSEVGSAVADDRRLTRVSTIHPPGVSVCLLGSFRILKGSLPLSHRPGGKVERLVGALALNLDGVGRDELLEFVWPESDTTLAGQSLNSLVHWLYRSLSEALAGSPPVVRDGARYRLNVECGVSTDIQAFDEAVDSGDQRSRIGDVGAAMSAYSTALQLYGGDLAFASGIQHVIERERLRARHLSVYARLADLYYAAADYERTLIYALKLLRYEPCREDAHRMVMRCHVRLGQRAQAMRQYRVCTELLALEYDARPEEVTDELYRLVRTDPSSV